MAIERLVPKVETVVLGPGAVAFKRGEPPLPASEETAGNIRIEHAARPGLPAHFEVAFQIEVIVSSGDALCRSILDLTVPMTSEDDATPYRQIESEAARSLAPAFRSVADRLQALVEAFDQEQAAPPARPE